MHYALSFLVRAYFASHCHESGYETFVHAWLCTLCMGSVRDVFLFLPQGSVGDWQKAHWYKCLDARRWRIIGVGSSGSRKSHAEARRGEKMGRGCSASTYSQSGPADAKEVRANRPTLPI